MEIASKYDPREVETKWYQYWLDNKLFASKPDGRAPYTVVIPPPNVTGVLLKGLHKRYLARCIYTKTSLQKQLKY
ncbi:MAG: hypothetical protein ACFNVK_11440 [Prevotella sp.]